MNYSTGRVIILVLWGVAAFGITYLPYEINDYLEVVMLIVAFISIQVFGETIDERIEVIKLRNRT